MRPITSEQGQAQRRLRPAPQGKRSPFQRQGVLTVSKMEDPTILKYSWSGLAAASASRCLRKSPAALCKLLVS